MIYNSTNINKANNHFSPYPAVVFSGYSGFLHQLNWLPRYNWNIVERGVKHHKLY